MIGFRLTTSTSTKMTTLFRSLTRVLRIGKEKYLVGHDLNNNAYYELPSRSGSNGKCKPPLINVTQLSLHPCLSSSFILLAQILGILEGQYSGERNWTFRSTISQVYLFNGKCG